MSLPIGQQMAAIRAGQVQFAQHIQLTVAQLAAALADSSEIEVPLPGVMSNLWLPPTWVRGDYTIQSNPLTYVLGVRINFANAPMLPWGLQGNNVASFAGPIEKFFVTLLSLGAGALQVSPITFLAARGIGVGYSGGLTAAGTPSASPSFQGGGNAQGS
jgi:hypothetical protein